MQMRYLSINVYIILIWENLKQDQLAEMQDVLHAALEQISSEKQYQEKCLLMLVHALEMCRESKAAEHTYSNAERNYLMSKYQLVISSVLLASLPRHFPGIYYLCCCYACSYMSCTLG